jgi:hypothetical protein
MCARRYLIPLVLALVAAGCSDQAGPSSVALPPVALEVSDSLEVSDGLQVSDSLEMSGNSIPILQQSPTAPPLETYQVSFWAYRGVETTVTVNYQPAPGESVGQPFLRLDIPQHGLKAGADGMKLNPGDSVAMTLTIDPVSFSVDFQPSGVLFSKHFPATLTMWYENANPDLNGDGVVDATDQTLAQQLTIWNYAVTKQAWLRLSSTNDPTQARVSIALYHFSQYAMSW